MAETLNQLPHLPSAITRETITHGLAGLCKTPELEKLASTVIAQWKNTKVFDRLAKHRIFPVRNVLLYGPPGNGKTTACQWIASSIDVPLYRVRCESLVVGVLGESAKEMRKTMDWLAKAGKCVVLFDEVETIFPSRDSSTGNCGREIASAMTVFWQMLDRWSSPQLFCFATNMPDALDTALMSRFELMIEFGPPDQDQVREVVRYWSEVFHDYAPDSWSGELNELEFGSYRELWQAISSRVREVALASN